MAVSVVLGIFAGVSATGRWRSFLLWNDGQEFGTADPYFHKDIGFYVFKLPWWHFVVDFAMTAVVVAVVAAALVHYLYGGIRCSRPATRSPVPPRPSSPLWPACSCCSRASTTGSTAST